MVGNLQPATVVDELAPAVAKFATSLPPGYSVAVGGTVEESAKGERPITHVVPLMLFLMAAVLMLQLQSFQKLVLVVSVAPLGLIGVVAALLPTGQPLGFVALLGVGGELGLQGGECRRVAEVLAFRVGALGSEQGVRLAHAAGGLSG